MTARTCETCPTILPARKRERGFQRRFCAECNRERKNGSRRKVIRAKHQATGQLFCETETCRVPLSTKSARGRRPRFCPPCAHKRDLASKAEHLRRKLADAKERERILARRRELEPAQRRARRGPQPCEECGAPVPKSRSGRKRFCIQCGIDRTLRLRDANSIRKREAGAFRSLSDFTGLAPTVKGDLGERLAAEHLRSLGWYVFDCLPRWGGCDLIAVKGEHVVRAEIKVGRRDRHGRPQRRTFGQVSQELHQDFDVLGVVWADHITFEPPLPDGSGTIITEIAAEYGVAQTLISQIMSRKIWKHLPPAEERKAA